MEGGFHFPEAKQDIIIIVTWMLVLLRYVKMTESIFYYDNYEILKAW